MESELHPLVLELIARYETWRQWAQAPDPPFGWERWQPLNDGDHRRHRVISQFLRMLESRGATVGEGKKNGEMEATINGQTLVFQIREIKTQRREWAPGRRSVETKSVGTGVLKFSLRTYLRDKFNEEWRDSKAKPMEARLPAIADHFFEGAEILKALHQEHQDAEEARQQDAARRAENARLKQIEAGRRAKLFELVGQWRDAEDVRHFVARLRSGVADLDLVVAGKSVSEWLAWADEVADDLDVTGAGAAGVFGRLEERRD